ncbi:MAG: DUF5752 family protein [Candidatus Bathyarchaeia archaeon]
MKEEQLKVLRTMHDATGRMDINMFAHAVNLTPEQTLEHIHLLANEGFLHKVGSGFCLTDKGKNALKISTQVPAEKAFNFYVGEDKPLGFSAKSIEEFYRVIRQVTVDSIDFHLYRGDFERWVEEVLQDQVLADKVDELEGYGLNGEELRKALLKIIDERYGVGELL